MGARKSGLREITALPQTTTGAHGAPVVVWVWNMGRMNYELGEAIGVAIPPPPIDMMSLVR